MQHDVALLRPLWLLLLPFALLLAWAWGRGGGGPRLVFPNTMSLVALGWRVRARNFVFGAAVPLVACSCLIVGLAGPVLRVPRPPQDGDGIDIMVAFDVSFSMNIADVVVDGRPQRRFETAKDEVRRFVEARSGDRIGLVAFAGRPVTVAPLTRDHRWLIGAIERLHLNDPSGRGTVREPGTAIGSAIATSAIRLTADETDADQVILLVTDGANNSGKIHPIEAAQHAAKLGLRIYTVALGTEEGRLDGGVDGPIVRQEFDLPTLREIARITGAESYWAQSGEEMRGILDAIDQLETSPAAELDDRIVMLDASLPLAGIALACLCVMTASRMRNPPPVSVS